MTSSIIPKDLILAGAGPAPAEAAAVRWARTLVLRQLQRIASGSLELSEGGRSWSFGTGGAPRASVVIHDPRTWQALAFEGTVGAGEAFINGWWSADDTAQVVRVIAANREACEGMDGWRARLGCARAWIAHKLSANTRRGSRRNIAAHYDLGNDFFREVLDPTMAYSSGIFAADAGLAEAQAAKYEAIARRLRLKPGERVVEIGTGWGGLAIHLARHHGVHVTTATISREQHRLASERVREAGLAERVEVRLCDYRDLHGTWDKLVSVEMVEAVGHRFYATYFRTIARLLEADGLALIQAITIQDRLWAQAVRNVDFIQRFVFPGSEIPSVSVLTAAAACAGRLGLVELHDFGAHYARTLECWRQAARDRAGRIRALGYPEAFLRLWEYYMAYCIGGFAERTISVAHLVFANPGWRDDDHARLVGDA